MKFNVEDYKHVKKKEIEEVSWKTAKYRREKYGHKENKTLINLRKGLVILLATFFLKMGGQIAYDDGYNSDFVQHFWDDVIE